MSKDKGVLSTLEFLIRPKCEWHDQPSELGPIPSTDASWQWSFLQEVGPTDFTKLIQFGAEVFFTDASWRFFELNSVDATAASLKNHEMQAVCLPDAGKRNLATSAVCHTGP